MQRIAYIGRRKSTKPNRDHKATPLPTKEVSSICRLEWHLGLWSPGGSRSHGGDITDSKDTSLCRERNTLACSVFMFFYFPPVPLTGQMQLEAASSGRCWGNVGFKASCQHSPMVGIRANQGPGSGPAGPHLPLSHQRLLRNIYILDEISVTLHNPGKIKGTPGEIIESLGRSQGLQDKKALSRCLGQWRGDFASEAFWLLRRNLENLDESCP